MGIEQPRQPDPSQSRQRRIGLTGGIASGKSSVARLLQQDHSLPLLDADVEARQALAPGSPAARAVIDRFGTAVVAPGTAPAAAVLNRAALGQIVFHDAQQRAWLEQLVHPIVRARFAQQLQALAAAPMVVLVVPLLFEAGLQDQCSEVWLVDCDEQQQLARLMARDSLSAGDARARIAAQWPLARKRPLAQVLIDNRGQPDALPLQVARALGLDHNCVASSQTTAQ
jgi:dephospho-CoA kinase